MRGTIVSERRHFGQARKPAPNRVIGLRRRLDVTGAAFLGVAVWVLLASLFVAAVPRASADGANKDDAKKNPPAKIVLDKKFKGSLPITELTEDEAILHALNRLAYGPRPSDVEHIRQMGLAKWIDHQLEPKSIDDAALDQRLERYPTLTMSSKKLLDEFPPPNQAAKKEGVSKDEYKQKMEQKRQDSVAQMLPTGNDNFD